MRPRDAATLIIVRDRREVLVGVRSAGHVFMPHMYVFPGGRVDPGDARVPCPVDMGKTTEAKLCRSLTRARARALAMTAVRETFEETGLVLGCKPRLPVRSRSPHWKPFFDLGLVPDLAKLEYVGRAITPPNQVRRYDARFFMVDAKHMQGELRGNGELEDLRWAGLRSAHRLALSPITELMLNMLKRRITGKPEDPRQVPFFRELNGKELIEYE